jgi:DNA-binding NarL/FixJ family response regulator
VIRRDARVLLVDDNPLFLWLLEANLDQEGYTTIAHAVDAEHAVVLAGRHEPEVILLDHFLPGMHGLEALPLLLEVSPASRIIIYSMLPSDRLAAEALEHGAAAVVNKRDPMEDLIDAVRRVAPAD